VSRIVSLRVAAQFVQHLPDCDAGDGIETGCGLVEKKDMRIVDQAAGDFNAAAHSSGECFDRLIAPLAQVDGFQHINNILFALGPGDAIELGVDAQVFSDGEVGIAGESLGNDADPAADRVRLFSHVVTFNQGAPSCDRDEGGHHADERAFACAIGAEQTEDFAVGY
jgi:hypothetical protein